MSTRFRTTSHDSSPDSKYPVTDLQPAVRPISTYKAPVGLSIPEAQEENSLSQLGAALSRFNPTLQNVAVQAVTEQSREESAAALLSVQEAQKKNVGDLKEAQRLGLVPDGVSPNYIHAWKTNSLKLSAEKAHTKMHEAWSQSEERHSDDPQAFDRFKLDWQTKYNEVVLQNSDANQPIQYTALELAHSGYDETLERAAQSVHGAHVSYRIGEREKLAEETTSNLIMQRLDAAFDGTVEPDHKGAADSVNDVLYNPASGSVMYGGANPSKQNQLLSDAIITKAISQGDASILEVADHLGPDPGKGMSLSGTKYFREKAEIARQHIASKNWMADEHSRTLAKYRGDGTETLAQVEARAREDRAKIEQDYEVHKAHQEQFMDGRTKSKAAEPELSAIAKLHALNGDFSSVEIQQHLKKLADIDPDTYKSTVTWLQSSGKHANETGNLQTFTALRAELSTDPGKFNTKKIVDAAAKNQLTAGQVQTLFNEAESGQKAHREHPALAATMVNQLRSDLRAASMKSESDEYGSGRLAADAATFQFNQLAVAFLRSNPKATEWDVYKAMQPEIEKIARQHNPDLNQALAGQERHAAEKKEKQAAVDSMQDRVGKEVEQLRSQPTDERSKLDAALIAKGYKNKTQRQQLIEQMMKGNK